MRKGLSVLYLLLIVLWSGAVAATEITAQLLVYRVTEPGTEPYVSRLLSTPAFLRLDQGRHDSGFILLDRKAKIIYSVNPEDRTILLIDPPRQERKPPSSLRLSARRQTASGIPEVAGRSPEYWQFLVDDRLCRSAVLVPGLLPQANAAYAEYLDLLAYQQLASLAVIPQELQDPCDRAVHVYTPLAVLEKGLPLREWHETGWRQELVDFREAFSVSSDSFELPGDYHRVPLGGM
jgi:hypothetical protein